MLNPLAIRGAATRHDAISAIHFFRAVNPPRSLNLFIYGSCCAICTRFITIFVAFPDTIALNASRIILDVQINFLFSFLSFFFFFRVFFQNLFTEARGLFDSTLVRFLRLSWILMDFGGFWRWMPRHFALEFFRLRRSRFLRINKLISPP